MLSHIAISLYEAILLLVYMKPYCYQFMRSHIAISLYEAILLSVYMKHYYIPVLICRDVKLD